MNSRISPATHFNGAAALIQRRKNIHQTTKLSKKLLIAVRNNIVFRAIHFSYPIDTASGIWDEDLDDMPRNPAILLDLMSVEVAGLLADAVHTPPKVIGSGDDGDESLNRTDGLLERAQSIDACLTSWPETLPLHWHPIRVSKDTIPQEVIDAGIYEGSCEIYPDIMICSTWNDWRVARLRILHLIAQLRLVSSLDRGETGARIITEIEKLMNGICASIPFCLGSRTEPAPFYQADVVYPGLKGRLDSKEHEKTASAYGGWYLFRPFKESLQLGPYISESQQEWLHSQLLRLAKLYDIEILLAMRGRAKIANQPRQACIQEFQYENCSSKLMLQLLNLKFEWTSHRCCTTQLHFSPSLQSKDPPRAGPLFWQRISES
ncbi:hypothetical protein HO173_006492 [Letharia columbiana]|uniref:Uncharacterized protein n=1 Tax=Letharia columbiana TaxID=112416 RepID=A0A8H6FV10_9LECA|nr:uncharacterized protein HO173_006492 [Letharia columbiana]KAF6235297.1 hypothetical protein HO173_006492 [Letharia columbiana]